MQSEMVIVLTPVQVLLIYMVIGATALIFVAIGFGLGTVARRR
jgi:hypothetical protein